MRINLYICTMWISDKINMTKSGLQFKMTVFVTTAVLIVSAIVLLIMASFIRKDYESLLDERISDDIAAIAQSIEQRMLRIEEATNTMTNISSQLVDGECGLDSVLCSTVSAIDGIQGISVIFREGFKPGIDGYYHRYASLDADQNILLDTYTHGDSIENDPYWKTGYGEGKTAWTKPTVEPGGGKEIICYIVPLLNSDRERVGIVSTSVPLNRLTSFITEYKVRKDIDISAYCADSTMVIAPDDYILELAPDEMITRECSIDRLGWRLVLSADREIIDREVREAMLSLAGLILLMFFVITFSITLTVRHVARPFVERQQKAEKEKAVMDNEMQLASRAQNELVPHVFPPFPEREGIDIAACLHPARNIGGDLYDYFILGNRLYFCIGDVSGKGLQASLFMAATHYLFRSVAAGMSSSDAVRQMNISLCTDNDQCRFVTFWFGCLDLGNGELEYVNAGHDSPVLVRNGKVDTFPASENMPLGAWEEAEFISGSAALQAGDILFLYTDGVTEAMDADGHGFGKARMLDAVKDAKGAGASSVLESVLSNVRAHASGTAQSDDITMLCIRFKMTETK